MKILRITSLGYVGGGVENGIELLQPVLTRMGHEVRILSSDHKPSVPHFSHYEFKTLAGHTLLLKFLYRAFYPHAFFAVRRALRDFEPDVVQIHSLFEVSPSVLFLLKRYPTVLTVHGAEDYTKRLLLWAFPLHFFKHPRDLTRKNLNLLGWLHYLYHLFVSLPVYRLGFRNVDRFVVFSTYMQRMLSEEGIESVCIPNATKLYEPAPIDASKHSLLYVGRLEKIKGVADAILALTQVLPQYPDAHLTIAGRGEYEQELKQLTADEGLDKHVTFAGYRTRAELYELYEQATVVVVPSVWPEPFGKVGIEALSVGRPVVGSDVGGISEWLTDGETGYLVPPESPHAIADKVRRLFGDAALLERISARAVERAREFSIETHAERITILYREAIEAHADRYR